MSRAFRSAMSGPGCAAAGWSCTASCSSTRDWRDSRSAAGPICEQQLGSRAGCPSTLPVTSRLTTRLKRGGGVRYEIVAEAYRDLERASGRLELTKRLAALLADTPAELLPTVVYLCQGQ